MTQKNWTRKELFRISFFKGSLKREKQPKKKMRWRQFLEQYKNEEEAEVNIKKFEVF